LHPVIRTANDLAAAVALDEAHWVATAVSIDGLHADPTLLAWVDADRNGRITCWEMRQATAWLAGALKDRSGVTERSTSLALDAVDTAFPDGQAIHAAAEKMLRLAPAGEDAPATITLEHVRQVKAEVEAGGVSEAGVVLPAAAAAPEIAQFLTDVTAAVGGAEHPSGDVGVDADRLAAFADESAAQLAWLARGRAPTDGQTNDVFPLGPKTEAAYEVFAALRGKLEQYFAQCHAVALDESLIGRMGWTAGELDGLDLDDPAAIERLLAEAPIARAQPTMTLAFDAAVNPVDEPALAAFRQHVVEPIVGGGGTALSSRQWQQIKQTFAAHEAWRQAKPTSNIAAVDAERLASYQDERFAAAATALIAESRDTAVRLDSIRLVEKLLLYQSGLIDLANNLIAFPDLYDPKRRAMFEMGTLVMDGRRFSFAVKVADRNEHLTMTGPSNMYLMYVQVTPSDGQPPYEVAVPVTSGNKGNLCLGKRGLFIDRDGRQHGARVTHVVENPISLSEAMVAPFVRVGRMLTGKIEAITAKAEQQFDQQAQTTVSRATEAPPAADKPSLATAGVLAGAGVALAAVGTALAYITQTITRLHWYEIWIGIGGAVLAVLIPTVLVAVFKLRKRDLSAVLEGSTWAVNARMRLTHRLGRVFTHRPRRPLGSRLLGRHTLRWIVAAIVIAAILTVVAWWLVDAYA